MKKLFDKVVLVDDDDTSNYLSDRIIRKLDIAEKIVVLNNGKQAFDYFRAQSLSEDLTKGNIDLVLLDINMAVMNGFELLEALHYTNYLETLKIVILSTSQSPKDVDRAAQYRIYGYLTKPLQQEQLKQIVEAMARTQETN